MCGHNLTANQKKENMLRHVDGSDNLSDCTRYIVCGGMWRVGVGVCGGVGVCAVCFGVCWGVWVLFFCFCEIISRNEEIAIYVVCICEVFSPT